jgi:hypothetical protein
MPIAVARRRRRSDLLGIECSCCKGYSAYPKPCALEGCDHRIHAGDDNWVRLYVMHHNRIGIGELSFCTVEHSLEWLASTLPELGADAGEPHRIAGCDLAGHLPELDAIRDALVRAVLEITASHSALASQAALDAGNLLTMFQQREAFVRARAAQEARENMSYWSGVARGINDVLSAVRGDFTALHKLEAQMLETEHGTAQNQIDG